MPGSQLPGVVPARDSGVGIQDWEAAKDSEGFDFKRPVVAFVALSNGKRFTSDGKRLAA